jgi:hypothetical protein
MRMTMQTSLWISICRFVAGEVPDNEGFVSASRKEHIWTKPRVSILYCHL